MVSVAVFSIDSVSAARVENMRDVPEKGDFDLGPTSFPLVLKPGETVTKTLQLTNRIGETREFTVEVEDFEGSRDPDQAVSLQGRKNGRWSAKDWTKVELEKFTIDHGQRQFFSVTIATPENADAGDHYVSVLVKTSPKDALAEGQAVHLTSRVGALFFVRVPGDIVEDGALASFQSRRKIYTEAGKTRMDTVFANNGTVRVTPSGSIAIKDWLGRTELLEW
jgi:hypothetical protein